MSLTFLKSGAENWKYTYMKIFNFQSTSPVEVKCMINAYGKKAENILSPPYSYGR